MELDAIRRAEGQEMKICQNYKLACQISLAVYSIPEGCTGAALREIKREIMNVPNPNVPFPISYLKLHVDFSVL